MLIFNETFFIVYTHVSNLFQLLSLLLHLIDPFFKISSSFLSETWFRISTLKFFFFPLSFLFLFSVFLV